jgi:hypothetical protein
VARCALLVATTGADGATSWQAAASIDVGRLDATDPPSVVSAGPVTGTG